MFLNDDLLLEDVRDTIYILNEGRLLVECTRLDLVYLLDITIDTLVDKYFIFNGMLFGVYFNNWLLNVNIRAGLLNINI